MSLKDAADTILQSQVKPDGSYDTLATVLRTDGDTVLVHIDGGAPETPCKKTVECKAGESVMVRISGGSAWITGNHTSPSTDDTEAEKAKEEARKAAGTATSFITDSDNGIFVHPKNSTQRGVKITDTVDIIRQGDIVARYGDKAIIGVPYDINYPYFRTRMEIDYQSLKFLYGSNSVIFNVFDMRNGNSYATIRERFIGFGTSEAYTLQCVARNTSYKVYVDGVETTPSTKLVAGFTLTASQGAIIEVVYETHDTKTQAFAFGGRQNRASEPIGCKSFTSGTALTASGECSVATGNESSALGWCSHAQNNGTIAARRCQTAIGRFNEIDYGTLPGRDGTYALIVGNGTNDRSRSNALTVDWNGNLTCNNVGAPVSIPTSGTGAFVVERTSGNSTCTVREVKKSGNMMMVSLSFKCTAAYTANGSNLFVGTIPTKYAPAMSTTGTGYIGNVAVIGQINHAGQLTIRPCGALANAAEPYVYFHYFI